MAQDAADQKKRRNPTDDAPCFPNSVVNVNTKNFQLNQQNAFDVSLSGRQVDDQSQLPHAPTQLPDGHSNVPAVRRQL